jgi:hypothetical protein
VEKELGPLHRFYVRRRSLRPAPSRPTARRSIDAGSGTLGAKTLTVPEEFSD